MLQTSAINYLACVFGNIMYKVNIFCNINNKLINILKYPCNSDW